MRPPEIVRLTPGKRVLFLTKDADLIRRQDAEAMDLESLLATADAVTLHVPMTDETRGDAHVAQPGEGRSFWQPVPANGYVELQQHRLEGAGAGRRMGATAGTTRSCELASAGARGRAPPPDRACWRALAPRSTSRTTRARSPIRHTPRSTRSGWAD